MSCLLLFFCFFLRTCVRLIGCARVASVQSEPGQQNLLIQPPLGRKRGLRQVRTGPYPDAVSTLGFSKRLFVKIRLS